MSDSLQSYELQHVSLPCPWLLPGVCSKSCPLNGWCHQTISPSVTHLSSCPQSLPASGSFPVSWLIASGGQRILTSALVSVLPVNIQGPFHLGLTGLISLQSKGLSRVCSRTIWKHQIFSIQPSLWSNSHISTWLLEKPYLWLYWPLSYFLSNTYQSVLSSLFAEG